MSGPVLAGPVAAPAVSVGWPLLPLPDADGRLSWPGAALSVRQRIEAVLRTAPGEQLMRPRFGAGLEALINQPNTLTVRAQARDAITDALQLYEDRIVLDAVDIAPTADGREVLVTIAYRLAVTGAAGRIDARAPVGGA